MSQAVWVLEPVPGALPPLMEADTEFVLSQDAVNVVPEGYRLKMVGGLASVRCPKCNRLICMATGGATVESVCPRCGNEFTMEVGAPRAPIASD